MHRVMITLAAFLLASGTVNATEDWTGSVKIEATYKDRTAVPAPRFAPFDTALDVVYDRNSPDGLAWGTLRYASPTERVYAHAICVGVLSKGDEVVVSGRVVKHIGGSGAAAYMTWEFDIPNKFVRVYDTSEKEAKEACRKPSGSGFPGMFDYGYVIVQ